MKFDVLMNGAKFARFDSKKRAEDYADMQRRKLKGDGLAENPLSPGDAKAAFAAKQTWEVKPA